MVCPLAALYVQLSISVGKCRGVGTGPTDPAAAGPDQYFVPIGTFDFTCINFQQLKMNRNRSYS